MSNSDNGPTDDGASCSGESATPTHNTRSKQPSQSSQESSGNFECNICLDTARDAVVSMCGHLFWLVNTLYDLLKTTL